MTPQKYVVKFADVGKKDVALVGGKGANLGEMTQAKFPVPNGFIITAHAYFAFLDKNDLRRKIAHLLGTIAYNDQKSIDRASFHIKKLITDGLMDEDFVGEVFTAYANLSGVMHDALVAVRSSATAEDLPNASFAGQQETFLNVQGEATLLTRIKDVWASLFDARAIFYRHEQKFDHFKVGIAIPVQQMVASVASGVMFTLDPVTNDRSKIVIEAIYGLGELIVQGEVTPDHYEVDKKTETVQLKTIAKQEKMLTRIGTTNKLVRIPASRQKSQKITDKQILAIADLGKRLEEHYQFPQDAEWAVAQDKIYLVQTRAITTTNMKNHEAGEDTEAQDIFLQGNPASPGMASGPVKMLKSAKELDKIQAGDILVAPQTNPDFVPAMKKAVAIVTQEGGRTSHAAIVSRELGIPAVVGVTGALTKLTNGMVITVNGTTGHIFKGARKIIATQKDAVVPFMPTATKVYVNLAQPDLAEQIAKRQVDGVGLLRAEFIMADIGVHPKKMIADGKSSEYIAKLAAGIASFAKAFSPRPVVYRTSDFKTNEYRNLIGGDVYEPVETNPMLGYRGAYRYIHDPEVFALEMEAIKKVRNEMGYKNVWMMLPFVRTVKELTEVKKLITAKGLYRSESFKLWMMVEIPSNVMLLDKFIAEGIDGISIGSNDLTMLTLGTDRDNTEVSSEFNEEDDAVVWSIERVLHMCHTYHVTSSFCGQAVSTFPNLVEKLVTLGITSVSVSPDALHATRELIADIEKKLVTK